MTDAGLHETSEPRDLAEGDSMIIAGFGKFTGQTRWSSLKLPWSQAKDWQIPSPMYEFRIITLTSDLRTNPLMGRACLINEYRGWPLGLS